MGRRKVYIPHYGRGEMVKITEPSGSSCIVEHLNTAGNRCTVKFDNGYKYAVPASWISRLPQQPLFKTIPKSEETDDE